MGTDEGPDYIIDIPGMRTDPPRQPVSGAGFVGRPFIHVRFACCNAYTRIYRNREGAAYVGYCPRCGRKVKARVGPGGTDARWFVAE
jgi:hypothetical protein